ncbi:MAG: V-type ATP synthase subunit D [Clostridiales bacterium]|nr:V-type ATP synthase subunit D [Clostridiales bacterium]
MARLNVNPTRMILTSLKKRLKTAVRGHKLMKDKRDELMKRFIDIARENKVLRDKVEEQIINVYAGFTIANAVMSKEVLEEALMYPKQSVEVKVSYANVMSVEVPVLDFRYKNADSSDIYPYGFANTSGELDGSIKNLSEVFPVMLELAAMEKKVALLAEEIEKTRRRVNALEYVMIPQLQETIKYIRMKLDENERGNQTRLMKVKDMMLKQAILEKQAVTEEALQQYASH